MKKQAAVWVLIFLAAGLLAGCSSSEPVAGNPTSRGKVVAVDAENNILTLNHQEIPGVMMAMTMPFAVADASLLEGLEVDDAVEFEVEQRATGLTIVAIRKIPASELGDLGSSSFEGTARVVAVVPSTGTIMIRATDIPGISGDGDLVYAVKPPSLLEGIEEGNEIKIKLEDDGHAQGQLVVTALKKIEK